MADLPTVSLDDFDIPNEGYWKKYAAKKSGGASFSAPPPRSTWDTFMDSVHDMMSGVGTGLNPSFIRGNQAAREEDLARQYASDHNLSPTDAEATIRQNQERRAADVNEARASRAIQVADEQRRRSRGGKLAAGAADIAGGIVGDINPTYAIGGGGVSALERILGMGAVTGANDIVGQGDEVLRGIREHGDPLETLASVAGGAGLQGAGEGMAKVVGAVASRLKISAGARMGNYGELLRTMMNLEGGGTLASPKISPRGAKGPAQVMDETARDPGYGIKPWDGKTESDRFRVGAQYLAALNHEFGGQDVRVLAAYNAGPNKVKHLINKYGDQWVEHLPAEAQKYVLDGMTRMHSNRFTHPENLGQVDIVAGEQPPVADQAYANDKLAELQASVPKLEDSIDYSADYDHMDDGKHPFPDMEIDNYNHAKSYLHEEHNYSPGILRDMSNAEATAKARELGFNRDWEFFYEKAKREAWGVKDPNLAPNDKPTAEIHSLSEARDAKKVRAVLDDHQKVNDLLDYHLNDAHDIQDSINSGHTPLTLNELKEQAQVAAEMRDMMPKNHPLRYKGEELADMYSDMVKAYHADPVVEKAVIDSSHEDFTRNPKDNVPANDAFTQLTNDPDKAMETYWSLRTMLDEVKAAGPGHFSDHDLQFIRKGLEDNRLNKAFDGRVPKEVVKIYEDSRNLVDEIIAHNGGRPPRGDIIARSHRDTGVPSTIPLRTEDYRVTNVNEPLVRDPNPPASSSTFGTRVPEGVNPRSSAPPKGDIHNIADARKEKELREFHAKLTGQVRDGAKASRILGQRIKNEGLLPFNVGDRFTTPKGRQLKQGPWKVVGYYADSKAPMRYGYWVERGAKGEDLERTVMLVSDPAQDAKFRERGMADWNRADDVAGWQKQGIIRRLLTDDEGAIKGSGDAEGPDGEKLPPEIKTNQKLLLDKLGDALDQSTPIRREAEAAMAKERARRLAAVYAIRAKEGGQAGFYKELAALKGSMGRPKIASIRDWFTEHEIDQMNNIINASPNLYGYQTINAKQALNKLLGADYGEIPTAREVELLAKAMPKQAKMWRRLLENEEGSLNLPDTELKKAVIGTLNIPKTLMASFDISAPLRQGVFMIGRKQFYTSLAPMLRALVSPKFDRSVNNAIFRDPLFEEMRSSGLAVPADVGHNGGPNLADLEEAYMTNLAQKIPLVGIGVRASERAYTTFIYKLRADTFKSIYNAGKASGKEWDTKSLHDLSRFINTFTGRGSLGKFNNMAPQLNTLFFSPRLLKSRLDALNPAFYAKLDPTVRKEAFKSILSFAAVAGSIMALAHLAGAEVDPDIRKPDGWKIKIGNTRHDILGGEQQLIRLMTNIGAYSIKAGKELYDTGKLKKANPFNNRTAIDNIGQFLRNKESPDVSFAHDLAAGNNAIGQDFNLKDEALSRVTPMAPADVYDAVKDLQSKGVPLDNAVVKGTLMTLDAWPGVSVQPYPPKKKVMKVNAGDFGLGSKTVSLKDFQ